MVLVRFCFYCYYDLLIVDDDYKNRKEDLEEESYFRKLSLCYDSMLHLVLLEVILKRKMPATGYSGGGYCNLLC